MCCPQKTSSSVDNDVMDTSTDVDNGAGAAAAATEADSRGENVITLYCCLCTNPAVQFLSNF